MADNRGTALPIPKAELYFFDEETKTSKPMSSMDVRFSDARIVTPVDIQGVTVPEGEKIPVEETGWKWTKVEATEAGDVTVKITGGKVATLVNDSGAIIYLVDGSTQAWKAGDYTSTHPIACERSIKVNFSDAGTAWVLYQ